MNARANRGGIGRPVRLSRARTVDDVTDRADGRDPFSAAKDAMIVAICRADLSGAAHRVGVFLVVAYANRRSYEETGQLVAWPSVRTLARQLGMFRGRLDRAIEALETAGLLSVSLPDGEAKNARRSYTLQPSVQAAGEPESGLTTVATSKIESGLTNEATENDESGLTNEATVASPLRPDLLEYSLEGAGALAARPAPFQEKKVFSIGEEDEYPSEDGGAFDRAPLTPTGSSAAVDTFDPDGWRSDPDFTICEAALPEAEDSAGCAPEGAPAHDLSAEALEEEVASGGDGDVVIPAEKQPSRDLLLCVLEDIYERTGMDAPHGLPIGKFVELWTRGFIFGLPAAQMETAQDTARVIVRLKALAKIDPDEYLPTHDFSREHLLAIGQIAKMTSADAESEARAMMAYEKAVALRVARLEAQERKEAAYA